MNLTLAPTSSHCISWIIWLKWDISLEGSNGAAFFEPDVEDLKMAPPA